MNSYLEQTYKVVFIIATSSATRQMKEQNKRQSLEREIFALIWLIIYFFDFGFDPSGKNGMLLMAKIPSEGFIKFKIQT